MQQEGVGVIGLVALNLVCGRPVWMAISWKEWKEAPEANVHCEHSFFLFVGLFEVSLRAGQVSSWGLSKAGFSGLAHCWRLEIIGAPMEGGS